MDFQAGCIERIKKAQTLNVVHVQMGQHDVDAIDAWGVPDDLRTFKRRCGM